MAFSLNLITIIIFYAVLAVLIYNNRHKIELHKIFLLYRTQRGIKTMSWLAKAKRFWRTVGYIAVPIGYIGMILMLGLLVHSLWSIITVPAAQPGVSVIVPGVKVPGSNIFLPFWYGIISLALLIIVHEGAHGVIARAHDIKLKNTGVGLFLFIPLAFVEPEEKDLRSRPFSVQASVFSAGSIANFALGSIALLLGILLIFPAAANVVDFQGLEVTGATANFPAEQAGIMTGDVITAVNGIELNSTETLANELYSTKPGDTISLGLADRDVQVTTTTHPDNESIAYLGVSFEPIVNLKPSLVERFGQLPWALVYFSRLLVWVFFLNIGVGLFNLLPLGFVDGGRMAQVGLKRFVKNPRLANSIFTYASLFSLLLILLNIFGPIIF